MIYPGPRSLLAWSLGIGLSVALVLVGCARGSAPVVERRPPARAFLDLPAYSHEALPTLLSRTGVFSDVATLTPAPELLAYEVNAPLWSDGAHKRRWISLPFDPQQADAGPAISFSANGGWYFPSGTVLVKHFALPVDERDPTRIRRLETRVLVRSNDVPVYGATYRWRDDQSDAELVTEGQDHDLVITTRDGGTRTQRWHYPSRSECLSCHNRVAGPVLGVNTRQLNRRAADGVHQLRRWNDMGLFDPPIPAGHLDDLPRLVPPEDETADLGQRVRSYLDANCSHCHRPGALPFVSYDARFETPLERQNLLDVRPVNDYGIDRVRYVKPNDPWRSMILVRLERGDSMRMPPLGRNVPDRHAIALVRRWIRSLEGTPALPPPVVTVAGEAQAGMAVLTASHDDPLATLHYTVDGSLPDDESPRYTAPLRLTAPVTVRVKALRHGFISSIAVAATVPR
jgi:uncharacterized repeat protein (TIGR03806 family)